VEQEVGGSSPPNCTIQQAGEIYCLRRSFALYVLSKGRHWTEPERVPPHGSAHRPLRALQIAGDKCNHSTAIHFKGKSGLV
jgi:hypothetical protein